MKNILHKLTLKNWPSVVRLAKKGDPEYQYMMGVAYLAGGPVKIDLATSYFWFTRAAENKHGEAAFRAGFLLHEYNWPDKPDVQPDYWYLKAEDLDSPEGITALANLWTYSKLSTQHWYHKWLSSKDLSPSSVKSYLRYDRACTLKYVPAFYYKALHLLKGWGCAVSKESALAVLRQGSELGDNDCSYLLSQLLPSNNQERRDLLLKASEGGHSASQYELAECILKDSNINDEQAVTWLRRSAIQQYPNAVKRLAYVYYYGRGVKQDFKESYIWAARAKKMGFNIDSLLFKNWKQLSDESKLYFSSPIYDNDQNEFFKLSNNLFNKAGFQF